MKAETTSLSFQTDDQGHILKYTTKSPLVLISTFYNKSEINRIIDRDLKILQEYALTEENVKFIKERGKCFV